MPPAIAPSPSYLTPPCVTWPRRTCPIRRRGSIFPEPWRVIYQYRKATRDENNKRFHFLIRNDFVNPPARRVYFVVRRAIRAVIPSNSPPDFRLHFVSSSSPPPLSNRTILSVPFPHRTDLFTLARSPFRTIRIRYGASITSSMFTSSTANSDYAAAEEAGGAYIRSIGYALLLRPG